MKGRKVTTLARIVRLAKQKKAVVVEYGGRYTHRTPAAFILHWKGSVIWLFVNSGSIHEYKSNKK